MPLTSSTPTDDLSPGRVRKLIRARKQSQAQVARAAGIGEAEVSRIVSRNMHPTPGQARRLLEVLEPFDETARTPVQMVTVSDNGE